MHNLSINLDFNNSRLKKAGRPFELSKKHEPDDSLESHIHPHAPKSHIYVTLRARPASHSHKELYSL